MTEELGPDADDGQSVLTALGLDPDADYAVPEHLWTTALAVALDPDTPPVDAANVPIMDDHGTVPDTDDAVVTDHAAHHEAYPHDTASHDADHVHLDPGHEDGGHGDWGHDDRGHDDSGHDGGHDPGSHDPGSHGSDWHV